jgi:hypothetical protein
VERHFTVQDTVSEEDFKALVKDFLKIGSRIHIPVTPLGLDRWEIRPGFTYWVAETRLMEINITDTAHGRTRLKIRGNSTLESACELFKSKWNIPDWDEITHRRADDTPFWVEDKGDYVVEIRYDPAKDPREQCTVKVVTSVEHQIFLIESCRVPATDSAIIWADICSQYGFISPSPSHLQVSGHPDDGLITFTYKMPASVLNVRLPAYISRTFRIIEEEEEWNSGEILSLQPWGREEIWAQLMSLRTLPHYSQFHFSYSLGEIPKTSRTLPQDSSE